MSVLWRFFSCSHHAVVEDRAAAVMGIAKCEGRMWHKGSHRYPFGLVAI